MTKGNDGTQPPPERESPADPLKYVEETVRKLRFGAIHLTVHEGRLVQIEVTEKRRFV